MATRYWVGGTGTWDATSTTNWSTTSGGAGGASAPVAADTVIFDSLSGTGTCTTASGSACATATLNTSTLGLTLGSNHTMSGTFTLTLGTLSLGSSTLSCNIFSSNNSNTRTIAFGTGNITLTGNGNTIWSCGTLTGFSYTGTPTVNATYSGATSTRTFGHGTSTGGTESNAVSFNISAGTDIVAVSGVCKNLNFTGFSGTFNLGSRTIYGNLVVSSGMTVNGGTSSTTFGATSGTQQITTNGKTLDFPLIFNGVGGTFQLQDNCTVGSTRTVTLTNGTLDLNNLTLSCGLFNANNSNTRSILFGTGKISITGNNATVFNLTTATGFTYTGTSNIEGAYSGSTGTRTFLTGSGTPEAASLNYNITAGSDTVQIYYKPKSIDFTGFTGTWTLLSQNIFGGLTLSSEMTLYSGTNTLNFTQSSGTANIITNGKTLDFPMTFNGANTTFAFQDALTQGSTRAFTITNGTVQLKAGVTSTVGSFATSGSNQKYLQSTTAGSQATLSQASGVNSVSYLTISDSFATGGATWDAFYSNGNIDAGNNTNWDFGATPVLGAEYEYKLRSFTEPRRF